MALPQVWSSVRAGVVERTQLYTVTCGLSLILRWWLYLGGLLAMGCLCLRQAFLLCSELNYPEHPPFTPSPKFWDPAPRCTPGDVDRLHQSVLFLFLPSGAAPSYTHPHPGEVHNCMQGSAQFQDLRLSQPNVPVNYRRRRCNWRRGHGWWMHVINGQDRVSRCYWEFKRKKEINKQRHFQTRDVTCYRWIWDLLSFLVICEAGLALNLFCFHKDKDRWKPCTADILSPLAWTEAGDLWLQQSAKVAVFSSGKWKTWTG